MRILSAWTDDTLTCRNGIIADYSLVLSGCTKGNAVPLTTGAGQGSKAACFYQIKYMSKESVEISASASMLMDAYQHNKIYLSTADDADTYDRQAKYFCQRVLNHACMELEGLQAAGIVLGHRSSGSSDALVYYSGWDVQRLARIASAGHAGDVNFVNEVMDDDNQETNEIDDDGSNDVEQLRRAVASESMLCNANTGTIDLLSEFNTSQAKNFEGYAQVYKTKLGEHVPVSTAHHYMHRDLRLWRFSAYEFVRLFQVRAMNETTDKKWFDKVTAQPQNHVTQPQDPVSQGGRSCQRFLLLAPHPLHTSHMLVPRQKLGIPAFAGTPPPNDTSSLELGPGAILKRKRYAEFYVSNFIPWSAAQPPLLTYETWTNHMNVMEDEACLHRNREPDMTANTSLDDKPAIESEKRSRFIAAGRLFDVETLTTCFKTKHEAAIALGKHRARARALWNQNGNIKPHCDTGPSDDRNRAVNAIQRLQDKADKILCAPNQAIRQTDAAFATKWSEELNKAMRYSEDSMPDGSTQQQQLQSNWKKAAFPTKKSLTGGIRNPKELAAMLKKPLELSDASDWYAPSTSENANNWNAPSTLDITGNDPFAEITDVEYESAAAEHKLLGRPLAIAPLNPEQRESGRHVLQVAPPLHTNTTSHPKPPTSH